LPPESFVFLALDFVFASLISCLPCRFAIFHENPKIEENGAPHVTKHTIKSLGWLGIVELRAE
jgi:hypothetical protein